MRQGPRLSLSPIGCAGVGPRLGSLTEVSKELAAHGYLNERDKPYAPKSVASMCARHLSVLRAREKVQIRGYHW